MLIYGIVASVGVVAGIAYKSYVHPRIVAALAALEAEGSAK